MERMTLANLLGGAVEQLFGDELDRVLENIDDPNQPATAKRVLAVELIFKPTKNRQAAEVSVRVSARLPEREAIETNCFLVMDPATKRLTAVEHNPHQATLPLDNEPVTDTSTEPVTPFRRPGDKSK